MAVEQYGELEPILNFGSLNIDHVYRVPHFVQPGETVSARSFEFKPGGKGGNQSTAAGFAGANVHHAGRIGHDGQFLLDRLVKSGIDVSGVTVGTAPTGHAMIQVDDDGQNSIVIWGGGNWEITKTEIDQVLDKYSSGTRLMLQNGISNVPYLIQQGAERGMKIYINPAPMDPQVLNYPLDLVDTLIVNEIEGAALAGGTSHIQTLSNLALAYPDATIVLTLGAQGVLAQYGDQRVVLAAEVVDVVDTTAAGDTFTGYFVARREAGDSLPGALKIANHASAIAVSRPGQCHPSPGCRKRFDPARRTPFSLELCPPSSAGFHRTDRLQTTAQTVAV